MSDTGIHFLYIEDNLADLKLLEMRLRKSADGYSYVLKHSTTLSGVGKLMNQYHFQLFLLDLSLPDAHGLEGVLFLQKEYPAVPIVVLTGNNDKSIALEAIKIGAQDYLVKGDFSTELFFKVCNYAIERKKINTQLNDALGRVEKLNTDLSEVNGKLKKTVEALQEEKKRVVQKNKQINSFISMLVHELKNPVRAINALTELMMNEPARLTIPQTKYLNQIKHSSSSVLDNILTIIETTKVKREGDLNIDMVHENPYFTMNSAIDKFIVEAIQKNIIIVIGYIKELPKVYFDKRLLVNVISNILRNVIKFNEENSRVVIHCEKLEDDTMKVSIDSQGLSLSAPEVEMVFDESHDLGQGVEKEEEEPSSGFDLSVAKKFVEIMGGKIGAEQNGSKGTIFWFTLQTAKRRQAVSPSS